MPLFLPHVVYVGPHILEVQAETTVPMSDPEAQWHSWQGYHLEYK